MKVINLDDYTELDFLIEDLSGFADGTELGLLTIGEKSLVIVPPSRIGLYIRPDPQVDLPETPPPQ